MRSSMDLSCIYAFIIPLKPIVSGDDMETQFLPHRAVERSWIRKRYDIIEIFCSFTFFLFQCSLLSLIDLSIYLALRFLALAKYICN